MFTLKSEPLSPASRRVIGLVTSYRLGKNVFSVGLLWVVYSMSHSALLSGAAFGAEMLPIAAFFPVAGWMVDRFGRNRLLIPLEILRILSFGGLILLLWLHFDAGLTAYLFLLAVITGIADSLYTVSLYGVVRDSSTDQSLSKTNAWVEGSGRVAQLLSPLLASFLLTRDDVSIVFAIPVACSIVTALLLTTVRDRTSEGKERSRIALFSGFSALRQQRTVSMMTIIAMVTNIAVSVIGSLLIYYLRSEHIGSWRAGLALDMGSLGILAVSVITPKILAVLTPKKIIAVSIGSMGIGISLVAIHSSYGLLCFALALGHGPVAIYNTFMQTTIQSQIPRQMLGRIGGAIGSLATASMPIAGVLSGIFAQSVGVPSTILVVGILTVFTGIVGSIFIPSRVSQANSKY